MVGLVLTRAWSTEPPYWAQKFPTRRCDNSSASPCVVRVVCARAAMDDETVYDPLFDRGDLAARFLDRVSHLRSSVHELDGFV